MQSVTRGQMLSVVGAWAVLGAAFMVINSDTTHSQAKKGFQEPDPVVMAIRRGGLREAARIKRHYVGTQTTTGWAKYDLEALASSSSVVIIGTPLVGSSNLAGSGDQIITEFKIKVDRAFKGKLGKRLLNVVVPGGKVTFEDGTSAEIKTPDLGPIEKHQKYVFFLKPSHEDPEVFYLTGGGQGLFELSSSEAQVKPRGDTTDTVQRHKDQKVSDFIEEVEAAVKRHPDVSPCCN